MPARTHINIVETVSLPRETKVIIGGYASRGSAYEDIIMELSLKISSMALAYDGIPFIIS